MNQSNDQSCIHYNKDDEIIEDYSKYSPEEINTKKCANASSIIKYNDLSDNLVQNEGLENSAFLSSKGSVSAMNVDNFYLKINVFTKSPFSHEGNATSTTFYTRKDYKLNAKVNSVIQIGGLFGTETENINKSPENTHFLLLKDDKYANKNHLKLDCTNAFHQFQPFRKAFYEFLKICHHAKGHRTGKRLPNEILYMIFNYITEPRFFTITDMGSEFGTYFKIKFHEKMALKAGYDIIIGTHIHLNISRVVTNYSNDLTPPQKLFYYKYLCKEIIKNRTIMIGLPDEDQTKIEHMFENYLSFFEDKEFDSIEIEKKYEFHMPYIKFTVISDNVIPDYGNSTTFTTPRTYLIFCTKEPTAFIIGRNAEVHVHINHISASRKHCRIMYECGQWFIADGVDTESSNGTWVGLTDYRLKDMKVESLPYQIRNGTELKLGSSILLIKYGKLVDTREGCKI